MSLKPTAEQLSAMNSPAPCLVSAAAGSGKTTVIAKRVAKILADETQNISAEEIAVVTFTNMAAAEMRERIEREINNAIKENPNNNWLKKQKLKLHLASISTINSFCLKIVKEYFYELNIGEDVKIASNADLEDLQEQAFAKTISNKNLRDDKTFDNLLKILGGLNGLRESIANLHTMLSTLPWADEWCENALSLYDEDDNGKNFYMQDNLQTAQDLISQITDSVCEFKKIAEMSSGFEKYVTWAKCVYNQLNLMQDYAKSYDWNKLYDALAKYNPPKNVTKNKDMCEIMHAKFGAAKTNLKSFFEKIQKLIYADETKVWQHLTNAKKSVIKLIDLTKIYDDEFMHLKRQKNILTFADAELLTLKLIACRENSKTSPTSIGLKIADELRQVIIDEYQDTNTLQDEILNVLSSGGQNLFVVGDVKQSIYAFRQANPKLFMQKLNTRKDEGGYIALNKNWRSNYGICDFVNFVFNLTMNKKTAELDYLQEDNLVSSRENSSADVDVHVIEYHEKARNKVETEANYIAKYIKNLLNDDENLRLEDFAILLRGKSKMEIYKTALENHNIPAVTIGKDNFFEAEEIIVAINLLKTINNPTDVPLAGVMLSPVFAFTAEDLAKIKVMAKPEIETKELDNTLVNCLKVTVKKNEKVAAVLKLLNDLKYAQKDMDLCEFISLIYNETKLFSITKANDETAQRSNNLLKLMDIAAKFESISSSLPAFLRYLEKMARLEDGGTGDENGGNAVKIMTIHKSKGLEFNHCILANCDKKFNVTDGAKSLIMSRDHGIGIISYDENFNARFNTAALNSVINNTLSAAQAEELRILYVALTRAVKKLTIISVYDEKALANTAYDVRNSKLKSRCVKNAKSFNDIILMCLKLHPGANNLREKAGVTAGTVSCNGKIDIKLIGSKDIEIHSNEAIICKGAPTKFDFAVIEKSLNWQYPHSGINDLPVKVSAGEISKSDGEIYLSRPNFMQKGGLKAHEKGTALHEFMERCIFENCEISIAKEADRLMQNDFLTTEQRNALDEEKIERFFKSALYREIKSAGKIWREQKFMLEVSASDDIFKNINRGITGITKEKIVLQGAIDCMIKTNDDITIIDYKTDRDATPEILKERYKSQLNVYKRAVKHILKAENVRSVIYSFHLNAAIELD